MATFNPSNVMLMESKTGEIPTEQGDLIITKILYNFVWKENNDLLVYSLIPPSPNKKLKIIY